MDPDAWERLQSAFFGALAVAPEEREAYLDRACAGDAEFRAEVNAVLAAHFTAGEPDGVTSADEVPRVPGSMMGARIGAYRLEELLGRGGMGEVYRAQRVDEQYHREVAVKVVRSGLGADEVSRRFRIERQILANLQHPSIATLLEGGVTPDGQPYLVMEYVRGVPITEYADAHRLAVRERLRLFRTVCEAVQYAHRNLVVHRDLKPSNILVTAEGRVRLLDFGIAKLLDPEDAGAMAARTADTLVFTPGYAAPEQLQRQPITTATDVYALGVLLYELLTGARPFDASTPLEFYHAVCNREPSPPSALLETGSGRIRSAGTSAADVAAVRHTRPRDLARQLRGDLDHIVLMALRKEPERRYASAGQFAEDVTRFLDGRPVLARPDSVGYRLRRFIGRNRAAVTLASLAAASLVFGLLGTTWQARRARAEAVQAAADRDRAERLSALLVDMFRMSDPNSTRGETVTAREVLARGAERIADDFAGDPESQADLLAEVGRIYENLGLFDDASGQLERALELRRTVHGEAHPRVAESMTRLAELRIQQGREAEAVGLARTATAILREHGRAGEPHPALAEALLALGGALRLAGSPEATSEASEAYTEALSLLRRSANPDDARIAQALYGLAVAAHGQGEFDRADSLLERSIERYARLGGAPHPEMATSLNELGTLRMIRRRPAEAEPLFLRALALRRQIYGEAHPAVAQTLMGLARARSLLGRFADAVDVGEEAVAMADSVWGSDHPGAAEARLVLGFILLNVDEGERAVQLMEEANAVHRARYAPTHPLVFGTEITIAQAYASMGQFDRARTHLTGTLDRMDAVLGRDHPYRASVLLNFARLDLGAGRLDDAETNAQASLALTRRVLRPDHRFGLWARMVLAQVHMARGRLALADSLLRDLLETQRATVGARHPETALTLVRLADVETRLGRPANAEANARAALAIFESVRERGPSLAEARSVLGAALAAQGRVAEAEPLLRSALEALARARGATPSQVAAAEERLQRLTTARSQGRQG
ncbi:MAG TPA: serine/threonine-protein kinase [Longimicrobiales bacterium]